MLLANILVESKWSSAPKRLDANVLNSAWYHFVFPVKVKTFLDFYYVLITKQYFLGLL